MPHDDSSSIRSTEIDALPFIDRSEYYCAVIQQFDASAGEVASLTELVTSLAAQDSLSDDRDQIALVLHHIVLPKLADCEVIEYDARAHTIRHRGHQPVEQVFRSVSSRA